MLETTITLLAIVCAASVATLSAMRWRGSSGFRAAVYMAFAVFAGIVSLLNFSALFATDGSFFRTAALAYLSFATAVVLPAAKALGNLTYETPASSDEKDARV